MAFHNPEKLKKAQMLKESEPVKANATGFLSKEELSQKAKEEFAKMTKDEQDEIRQKGREKGLAEFEEKSDEEKAKWLEKHFNYDYENCPVLSEFSKQINAGKDILLFHEGTTGLSDNSDITQFAMSYLKYIGVGYREMDRLYLSPVEVSKEALAEALDNINKTYKPFNCFESGGLNVDDYTVHTENLIPKEKAESMIRDKFLPLTAKDDVVIVSAFPNEKILKRDFGIEADIQILDAVKEFNGRAKNEKSDVFCSGRASIPNIYKKLTGDEKELLTAKDKLDALYVMTEKLIERQIERGEISLPEKEEIKEIPKEEISVEDVPVKHSASYDAYIMQMAKESEEAHKAQSEIDHIQSYIDETLGSKNIDINDFDKKSSQMTFERLQAEGIIAPSNGSETKVQPKSVVPVIDSGDIKPIEKKDVPHVKESFKSDKEVPTPFAEKLIYLLEHRNELLKQQNELEEKRNQTFERIGDLMEKIEKNFSHSLTAPYVMQNENKEDYSKHQSNISFKERELEKTGTDVELSVTDGMEGIGKDD